MPTAAAFMLSWATPSRVGGRSARASTTQASVLSLFGQCAKRRGKPKDETPHKARLTRAAEVGPVMLHYAQGLASYEGRGYG